MRRARLGKEVDRMGDLVKVALVSDLEPGQGKTVERRGVAIALFNVDGTFRAIGNACCHHGGPLAEGELTGTIVTCPWHGWRFDVITGSTLRNRRSPCPPIASRCEATRCSSNCRRGGAGTQPHHAGGRLTSPAYTGLGYRYERARSQALGMASTSAGDTGAGAAGAGRRWGLGLATGFAPPLVVPAAMAALRRIFKRSWRRWRRRRISVSFCRTKCLLIESVLGCAGPTRG